MYLGPFFVEFNRHGLIQLGFESDSAGLTLGLLCRRSNTGHSWDAYVTSSNIHVDAGPFFFIDVYQEENE